MNGLHESLEEVIKKRKNKLIKKDFFSVGLIALFIISKLRVLKYCVSKFNCNENRADFLNIDKSVTLISRVNVEINLNVYTLLKANNKYIDNQ